MKELNIALLGLGTVGS
ncbi:hypothetical protein D592_15925, partial [Staphylococcus epidermidis 36-1]